MNKVFTTSKFEGHIQNNRQTIRHLGAAASGCRGESHLTSEHIPTIA